MKDQKDQKNYVVETVMHSLVSPVMRYSGLMLGFSGLLDSLKEETNMPLLFTGALVYVTGSLIEKTIGFIHSYRDNSELKGRINDLERKVEEKR